ncbi:MAG: hypothetical protein K2K47_02295, partial [Duncaniella sp.]|nr:hypothetical protein [Duncaniella sp.]
MKRIRLILAAIAVFLSAASISAADPTATKYTARECEGSSMPYPTVTRVAVPDSLEAVMINHVGRHGARFLSSSRYTRTMSRALAKADSLGTLTPRGREFRALVEIIVARTASRWGALDSLGMAEQRAIASRLFQTFPGVVKNARINAIASYSPRAIASMDEFTHQLSRLDNHVEIYTSSGRQNSPLLRAFDLDADYREYIESDAWRKVYTDFADKNLPLAPVYRLLGENYPYEEGEAQDLAKVMYKIIAGCSAMSVDAGWDRFLSLEEYNAMWSVENLHHYLTYSASTLSSSAPDMDAKLLLDIINTTDAFIAGESTAAIQLRFSHAETLMPLLALMHVPGCYYMTNYFDTVCLHWHDFYVVPMASN